MLTVMNKRDITTKGVVEANAFSIKANGKAFKVLIDGLYSDKIRAVIRELWSNAYDSHIAAGKGDRPFDCQLPTWADPVFRVRDYGTSLSHTGVMNLYTTVFESSKEDTNEQVGKLGLGSKSPFAYTDTFTVTAWMDGEKRIYSAFIGADYVPQIALMSRTPDNGIQGLEVSFPVKAADASAFQEAASRVAYGFDILPTIYGGTINNRLQEVSLEGDGWKLWKTSDYGLKAQARQGCVIYPLDADAVPNLTYAQRELLRSPVFIDFPIGELEISASREGLGYDATTCANIKRRLEAIEKEVVSGFEEKIKNVKTEWEAITLVGEMRRGNYPGFARQLIDNMKFRGKSIGFKRQLAVADLGHGFTMARLDSWAIKNGQTQNPEKHTCRSAYVEPGATTIYLHDTNERVTYAPWRLAEHFRATGDRGHNVIYIRGRFTPARIARLKVLLGRPPSNLFVFLHKLPAPDLTGGSGPRKPVKVKEVTSRGFQEVDVDFELGGIYVPLNRDRVVVDTTKGFCTSQGEYSLIRAFNALKLLDLVDINANLYGIPASLIKKVKGDQWVNLFDLVDREFSKLDIGKFLRYRALSAAAKQHSVLEDLFREWDKIGVTFDKGGAAHAAQIARSTAAAQLAALMHHKHHLVVIDELYAVSSGLRSQVYVDVPQTTSSKALDEMRRAYPLLGMTGYGVNPEVATEFAKYIKLIDNDAQSGNVRQVA